MKGFGLARLGRDCEIRYTPSGEAVAGLSLAFNYGKKGDDGKRPTQWVDASLWGKRAEALSPYLKKGGLVMASLEDVHVEVFQGKNGESYKLSARVANIELAVGNDRNDVAAPAPRPAPQRPAAAPQKTNTGFDEMDDDVPFILSLNEFAILPPKARRLRRARF